jgi:hypothetical protein
VHQATHSCNKHFKDSLILSQAPFIKLTIIRTLGCDILLSFVICDLHIIACIA